MPTLRSDQQEPHHARRLAESFGVDPARYDRARPRYPDELLRRIAATAPGPDFLDVGCGTGILARQLRALDRRVLGVEPDVRMADFARDTGIEVEVARFEEWAAAGRTFDAVVAGQTWHWVDPVAGAARAAEVLRSGGLLALCWNAPRLPEELAELTAAAYRRLLPDHPLLQQQARQSSTDAADPFAAFLGRAGDGIGRAGAFGEPEQWRTSWQRDYSKEEWLDGLPTAAGHDRFPPAVMTELTRAIGAAIDAVGGRFTLTVNSVALVARRDRQ